MSLKDAKTEKELLPAERAAPILHRCTRCMASGNFQLQKIYASRPSSGINQFRFCLECALCLRKQGSENIMIHEEQALFIKPEIEILLANVVALIQDSPGLVAPEISAAYAFRFTLTTMSKLRRALLLLVQAKIVSRIYDKVGKSSYRYYIIS